MDLWPAHELLNSYHGEWGPRETDSEQTRPEAGCSALTYVVPAHHGATVEVVSASRGQGPALPAGLTRIGSRDLHVQ